MVEVMRKLHTRWALSATPTIDVLVEAGRSSDAYAYNTSGRNDHSS